MKLLKRGSLKNEALHVAACIALGCILIGGGKTVLAAQTNATTQTNTVEATTQAEATTEVKDSTTEKATYKKPGKTTVTGEYSKKKIKLTWKKVKKADIYYIYKKNKKGKYEQIGSTDKLTYSDKDVKKNTYYSYKVVAAYTVDDTTVKGAYSAVCKVFANSVDPNKKMVALTFDDGPGPYTKEIVKCLKNNNARATFFVVGSNVDSYKSAVKAAYKIGCEIGNHSWNHSNLASLSADGVKSQMQSTDKKVKKITGENTTIMRAPYGSVSSTVKSSVNKPIILWSIDTLDWKTRSKSKTIDAVMNHVKDGDIVLMHDIHKPTKEAALSIIPQLRKKGYQLVTVSELAKYRGYKLKKGSVYHNLYKKK
jgi:peptidoglycan/xylan/chitin deacetylase (PgdA/CDA1 family)